jgi:hypothetical protein
MSMPQTSLHLIIAVDAFAELVAEKLVAKLGAERDRAPERVHADNAEEHGCTWSWIVARSREGKIRLHGMRGRRFVFADELRELMSTTMPKRRARRYEPIADALEDARAVVAGLAARRA